ncbi:Proteinase inhibitor I13 potato inhibitor I superfamily [Arabidopsis suecica]|uniref:Proteinase inhibitor I13 potato inhibitor I superfamily n=1 Tax=Arabidopsis suecica TaxID=45249 RepID=A0A8T2AJQ3_ARASU|nr:Proteinase inhibitor I13 potato inhibitor I superfamily [Arabidopsis suecica]
MSSECPKKNSWPELRGTNGDYAAAVIERENPTVDAIVILDGSPVTADFRCDRVRVFVDRYRIVVKTPTSG